MRNEAFQILNTGELGIFAILAKKKGYVGINRVKAYAQDGPARNGKYLTILPILLQIHFRRNVMTKKITILINQKPYHFEKSELAPQEFRDAVGAPNDYEVWLINKSPDPEGQLPVDDIQITAPVQIENGQRYRVVPAGTFG